MSEEWAVGVMGVCRSRRRFLKYLVGAVGKIMRVAGNLDGLNAPAQPSPESPGVGASDRVVNQ